MRFDRKIGLILLSVSITGLLPKIAMASACSEMNEPCSRYTMIERTCGIHFGRLMCGYAQRVTRCGEEPPPDQPYTRCTSVGDVCFRKNVGVIKSEGGHCQEIGERAFCVPNPPCQGDDLDAIFGGGNPGQG